MVFNATFKNILVILWWSILLVKETRVPGENHRPVASRRKTLSHNVVSSTPRHERCSNLQLYWWQTLITQAVVNPIIILSWPWKPLTVIHISTDLPYGRSDLTSNRASDTRSFKSLTLSVSILAYDNLLANSTKQKIYFMQILVKKYIQSSKNYQPKYIDLNFCFSFTNNC